LQRGQVLSCRLFHCGWQSWAGTQQRRCGFLRHLAQQLAERLAKGGPKALAATKHWLNELDGSLDDAIADEAAEISARIIAGDEAQSRLKAAWSR
jgi:hypothetical protein